MEALTGRLHCSRRKLQAWEFAATRWLGWMRYGLLNEHAPLLILVAVVLAYYASWRAIISFCRRVSAYERRTHSAE